MRSLMVSLLVMILLSVGLYGQTDSVYSFSLKEAQEFALKNNYEIRNSELDIQAAKKKIWETTAIGLPQIQGQIDYQYIPGTIPEFNMAESFIPFIQILNGIHPGEFDQIMEDMSQASSPIAVRSSTTYGFTVSQLVFSGEYIVGLQASKTYLMFSENMNEITKLDIIESVSNSYTTIKSLEKSISILDSSLIIFSNLVYETQKMFEQGLMESTDVSQIQLTKLELKNTRDDLQRLYETSVRLMKISLGLDEQTTLNLNDPIDEIYNQLNIESSILKYQFSIESNAQYKLLETNEKLSFLSMKREKSTFLPSVAAFYNYQDKTDKPDLDFTLNHIVGVSVSIPIFSSGQRTAKVQQAKIEYNKSVNTKKMMSDMLEMQAKQAYNNVISTYNTYENSKINIELSKQIFENTLLKHKNGIASSLELSQANNQYLLAINQNITALQELISAKLSYEKLNNNL